MAKAIPESSLEWMPKSIWGPIKWRELHVRALMDFPMDEQEKWFIAFVKSLPCPKCQGHFEEYIKNSPVDFADSTRFFAWTVNAHNFVNSQLGKKATSIILVATEIAKTLLKNP